MRMIIGLDIGGTKSSGILGDIDGHIIKRQTVPTPKGHWQECLDQLSSLVDDLASAENVTIEAAGVSFGGPWDSNTQRTHAPSNLPLWESVPLKQILEERYSIRVYVENDANATALAELLWGAGKGCSNFAYLTMGTGIGAGLILGGKLYRGRNDMAGEVGHAIVKHDGPLCNCGKRGCLEALSSGTAIGRIGRELYNDQFITSEHVFDLARSGDAPALKIITEAGHWMGIGISNLLHTLNLERVILGTLCVAAGDLLLPPIYDSVRAHTWPNIFKGVQILPAGLRESVQDMAALAVAVSNMNILTNE